MARASIRSGVRLFVGDGKNRGPREQVRATTCPVLRSDPASGFSWVMGRTADLQNRSALQRAPCATTWPDRQVFVVMGKTADLQNRSALQRASRFDPIRVRLFVSDGKNRGPTEQVRATTCPVRYNVPRASMQPDRGFSWVMGRTADLQNRSALQRAGALQRFDASIRPRQAFRG